MISKLLSIFFSFIYSSSFRLQRPFLQGMSLIDVENWEQYVIIDFDNDLPFSRGPSDNECGSKHIPYWVLLIVPAITWTGVLQNCCPI